MFSLLQEENIQWLNWLSISGLLLSIEILSGSNYYLLWSSAAATLTGFIVWICPKIHEMKQFILFSILTIFTSIIWWILLKFYLKEKNIILINQKKIKIIGQNVVLMNDTKNNIGSVFLDGTIWRVQTTKYLPAGTLVNILDMNGIILIVTPL